MISNFVKLVFGIIFATFHVTNSAYSAPKIAIIGGGIGGTSCAYFLKNVFQGKADVTIYERDVIGGRLNLVNIDGNKYESGGAVIHPKNQYMVDFANLLGLGVKKPLSTNFGIYNGVKFVIEESDWYIFSIVKFFWRYGISIFELWKDVKWMLDEFSSIYSLQKSEYAFTTVNGMLEYMNKHFRNMTQVTLLSELKKRRYSKTFLDELVQSVMMVNYGQTNNISAFAGFVSLAGADSSLWSVSGGNKQVPEGLLKESEASIVSGDVSEVILLGDGRYSLKYVETFSTNSSILSVDYDIVIIANPFIKDLPNIKFTNFKKDFSQYERTFHRTVATFVKGHLNPEAFKAKSVPDEIVVCEPHLIFNSIGKISPVTESNKKSDGKVYKVFSAEPLTAKLIDQLFLNVEIIKEKDWLAYPHYKPPDSLPPFMLYPNLYYINAIEQSASAMEMSAIGAKNVALLAFNLWHNLIEKVDHHKRVYKEEL